MKKEEELKMKRGINLNYSGLNFDLKAQFSYSSRLRLFKKNFKSFSQLRECSSCIVLMCGIHSNALLGSLALRSDIQ